MRDRDVIVVRPWLGTHIARWRGREASCTAGPEAAARRVGEKVIGHDRFVIDRESERDGKHFYRVAGAGFRFLEKKR